MVKEKVREDESCECYECPRCHKQSCDSCNPSEEVDFTVIDGSENELNLKIDWKGSQVCPFCYNQLIDMVILK